MGWPVALIEAAEDSEITQQEVTSMVTGVFKAGIEGMVMMGVMGMMVREFYGVLGEKKFAKQEKEVLEMVKEIW